MKILVTGSQGFIGWHLCRSLIDDGQDVIGFDSRINRRDRPRLETSCLRRVQELTLAEDYDVIVHLAASSGVPGSIANPAEYYFNNVSGMLRVLEIARDKEAKLVYASSSSVYGSAKGTWNDMIRLSGRVLSPYAHTKRINEEQAALFPEVNSVGLRFFTVFGPWGRPEMSILKMIREASEGKKIQIYGQPGQKARSYTYIDDVIAAIKIAMFEDLPNPVYNVCRNNETTPLENVAQHLKKHHFPDLKYEHVPQPNREWDIDVSRGTSSLPWEPKVDFFEGLDRTVKWFKEQR